MSFENASDLCKAEVPGSSLVVIKSEEDQRIVARFIYEQGLENETIITDARKLSASESQNWSWVNGHQIIPNEVINISKGYPEATGVALYYRLQSLDYVVLNVLTRNRYICEYSNSESASSYRQNNKSYNVSEVVATWYDARKECLRLGGDLASITDLQTIGNWSWLTRSYIYWIGLHRNKWIWNSTGVAITYTNWDGGIPMESSDRQCICIGPRCRMENNRTICDSEYDLKWRSCNCNQSYVIVCQKGLFNSFNTKIILTPLSLVAVAFIVVAVILIIRKRKYDRQIERSPMSNTKQNEAVSFAYTTVVPDNNRPSEGTVPPGNAIYANVEMTQRPTPPSNSAIYASVQPTIETVDMDKNVVYADLDFPLKDQEKPRSGEEITACFSPIYSELYEPPTSANYTEYAEPFNRNKTPGATAPVLSHQAAADQENIYSLAKEIPLGDPSAIYSEPNKPPKSSKPTGKAVTDPIYHDAIEVKHDLES